jgi:acyl carrier protein
VLTPAGREKLEMTSEEIFDKVRETLVDALGVDEEEVTLDSRLEADLGAESIDFLDMVFRLEKNFGIKIPRGELFPEDIASADSGFVKDGLVSAEGIASLKQKMPHFDTEKFAKDPKVENIRDMFTVQMLVKFVKNKLAA